jgi:hypothetical protein
MVATPVLEVGQFADHAEQRHAEPCIGSIIREAAAIAAAKWEMSYAERQRLLGERRPPPPRDRRCACRSISFVSRSR